MTKNRKNCKFCKKNAKIRGVEILKKNFNNWKLYRNLFSNHRGGSSVLEAGENQQKFSKNLKKKLYKKIAKICH